MKVGWEGIVRFRCQEPSILTLTTAFVSPAHLRARGSLTAVGVTAAEPLPTVQGVREEMPDGEIA